MAQILNTPPTTDHTQPVWKMTYYCKNCEAMVEDQDRISHNRCPSCMKYMSRYSPEGAVMAKNQAMLDLYERIGKLPQGIKSIILYDLRKEMLKETMRDMRTNKR